MAVSAFIIPETSSVVCCWCGPPQVCSSTFFFLFRLKVCESITNLEPSLVCFEGFELFSQGCENAESRLFSASDPFCRSFFGHQTTRNNTTVCPLLPLPASCGMLGLLPMRSGHKRPFSKASDVLARPYLRTRPSR